MAKKDKNGAREDEARIKRSKKEARARAEAAEKVRRKAGRKAAKARKRAAEDAATKLVQCARASADTTLRIQEPRSAEGAWDLHNHSVFSDGSKTVDELVAEARAAGLARIAITDHDTLAQLSYVRGRSRELGFPVLAGTEVSAHDPATGRKVHILAFGLEATPDASGPLERLVAQTLFDRTANTLWQAWVLRRAGAEFSGHTVSLDEVVAVAGESSRAGRRPTRTTASATAVSSRATASRRTTSPRRPRWTPCARCASRAACPCSPIPARWTRGPSCPSS